MAAAEQRRSSTPLPPLRRTHPCCCVRIACRWFDRVILAAILINCVFLAMDDVDVQVGDERWLALRRNLRCVWPRIMWLRAQKPPALGGSAAARGAESTELEEFDAWETMMASLARKAARRRGEAPPPFRWWSESHSCPL